MSYKMASLTNDERLNLKNLMNEMDYVDNTETIQRLKEEHSELRSRSPENFFNIVQVECQFLYDNYTDIFRRLMKDEVNITIMSKLLIVLKLIEDGQMDQQEGSVRVGNILKDLYLDSAVKRADSLDKEHDEEKEPINDGKSINWSKYKLTSMPVTH